MKYKQDSQGYRDYGPYALVDQRTDRVTVSGLDAEAVERELFGIEQHVS